MPHQPNAYRVARGNSRLTATRLTVPFYGYEWFEPAEGQSLARACIIIPPTEPPFLPDPRIYCDSAKSAVEKFRNYKNVSCMDIGAD